MSTATTSLTAEEAAQSLIPLMKEYTEKLNEVCKAIHDLWANARNEEKEELRLLRAEYSGLREMVHGVKAPAQALASHVSQLVEHGDLDGILRLELRLRLAEFEGALRSVDLVLKAVPPTLTA